MIKINRIKLNIQSVLQTLPTLFFLLFIFIMMINSYTGDVKNVVTDTKLSFESLEELSDSFEGILRENIYEKNQYIDLNGFVASALGINSLNECLKLPNGHLTELGDAVDISKSSESIIELNEFLKERGIQFIYLLAPAKRAFYDIEFAPGYNSTFKLSFDSMIEILNEAGVATIDMNRWYEERGFTMDDVYYRTDHHWKPNGALGAADATMELLYDMDWIDFYDKNKLNKDSYTIVKRENWFLGSQGKRVGIYYAGVDELEVYLPNFETDYTYSGLVTNTTNWGYSNTPLNLSYIENKDLYGSDPYCTYLYGDNPVQRVTNTKAPINKRVLIIGDSFRRVWEYFLTSQFQEIYSLDLRHYTDGTAAEFIMEIQPDIVIMCNNTPAYNEQYQLKISEYLTRLEATKYLINNISILNNVSINAQEDNSNNFIVLYNNLEPNQTYTLTLSSTNYHGGDDLYLQMSLQNLATNKAIYNRYFDVNSDETQKWIFTTPDDITGEYSIYLYAGTKDHTKNVSVEISEVKLCRGLFEN